MIYSLLMLLNFLLYIIVIFGTNYYRLIFFKTGIIIYKNKFKIKENHLMNYIGKIIKMDYVIINVVNENKILFNSKLDPISMNQYFPLMPVFGECHTSDNNVTVIYKVPIFLFSLIITFLIFLIAYNYIYIFSLGLFVFLLILALTALSHFIRINGTKFDIEFFLLNEK